MGRHRKTDRDLPRRMYRKHGAYWHKRGNNWTRLAELSDPVTAYAKFAEIEAGGTGRTLQDAINQFIVSHLPTLAPRTQADYGDACLILGKWAGHMVVDQITGQHVRQFLHAYPSPGRANKLVAILSSVLGWCVEWGWLRENPCTGIKRHKRQKKARAPSYGEIGHLRQYLSERQLIALDMTLITALRLGDLLRLMRQNWQPDGLHSDVNKTSDRLIFERTPDLEAIINRAQALKPSSLVLIPNERGQPYTVDGWESNWQRAKKAAGLAHIRWHDLRARALEDAAAIGGKDYAQALGAHSSVTTTEGYLRRSAAVMVKPLASKIVDTSQNSNHKAPAGRSK